MTKEQEQAQRDYAIALGKAFKEAVMARGNGDRADIFNAERWVGRLVVNHLLALSGEPKGRCCE